MARARSFEYTPAYLPVNRKTDGTVGTIVGGVAGALLGRSVDTHGERTTGTVLGAAGGALAGHAIDSHKECR